MLAAGVRKAHQWPSVYKGAPGQINKIHLCLSSRVFQPKAKEKAGACYGPGFLLHLFVGTRLTFN